MHEKLFPFKVFLTGSREKESQYFAFLPEDLGKIVTPETDWDYATQADNFAEHWLIKNNFKMNGLSSYCDNDTKFVYEKIIDGQKVQVSLRENLHRYIDCFNGVDWYFYRKYLHKSSPDCMDKDKQREFWNALYYAWDCGSQARK